MTILVFYSRKGSVTWEHRCLVGQAFSDVLDAHRYGIFVNILCLKRDMTTLRPLTLFGSGRLAACDSK